MCTPTWTSLLHALEQATLAYQSGSKALAKELGAKGRAANEAMHAAHAAAAAHIFQQRNAAHSSQVLPESCNAGRSSMEWLVL